MCGIAGFVNALVSEEEQRSLALRMVLAMKHRGPDEQGAWAEGPAAIANCRLSVIDLACGQQPMVDERNRAVVVFNGEIYNFAEIRQSLERKGVAFRTNSDTEVLLQAYLEEGTDCLKLFAGMFAFAIWDRRTKTLFAARDPMGKKPLYYTLQRGVFAFASELSAFRVLPFLDLTVSRESIVRYLAYEYVPTPDAIYKGVHKLRPGHFLTFDGGTVKTQSYWDLPVPEGHMGMSEEDCCEKLRILTGQAIKRRLVSDVPLGVFLSGGIDSSGVVALMTEQMPAKSIKTFSIGFTEPSYDESPYARLVASHFGTDHHEETLSAVRTGEMLPDIVARLDEPMSDPSIVPTYFLSQIARKKVTVALGGDGGDELFAGYEYFTGFKLADYYLRVAGKLPPALVHRLLKLLPLSTGYVSPRHVVEKFLEGTEVPPWLRTQIWLGAFSPVLQRDLWQDCQDNLLERDSIYAETRALYEGFPATEPMDRVFYLFARQYLLDYILVKVDRCSMMHSLEARAPFLDKDVVEFVFRLPVWMKLRRFTRKYLLKRALKNHLPRTILHRKKRGFLIPVSLWLKETLRSLVEEMLGEARLKQQGLFRPEVVRRLLAEHDSGQADRRKELWTMLILQLWLEHNRPSIE